MAVPTETNGYQVPRPWRPWTAAAAALSLDRTTEVPETLLHLAAPPQARLPREQSSVLQQPWTFATPSRPPSPLTTPAVRILPTYPQQSFQQEYLDTLYEQGTRVYSGVNGHRYPRTGMVIKQEKTDMASNSDVPGCASMHPHTEVSPGHLQVTGPLGMAMRNLWDHSQMMSALSLRNMKETSSRKELEHLETDRPTSARVTWVCGSFWWPC